MIRGPLYSHEKMALSMLFTLKTSYYTEGERKVKTYNAAFSFFWFFFQRREISDLEVPRTRVLMTATQQFLHSLRRGVICISANLCLPQIEFCLHGNVVLRPGHSRIIECHTFNLDTFPVN